MVMALQLRTSASFLASDLPQLVAARTQSAVRPGFVQRMGPPLKARRVDGETGRRVDSLVSLPCPTRRPVYPSFRLVVTDRVGFEPTVPLRAHRFSRPAVSTAHAPVHDTVITTATTRSAPTPPTLLQ